MRLKEEIKGKALNDLFIELNDEYMDMDLSDTNLKATIMNLLGLVINY